MDLRDYVMMFLVYTALAVLFWVCVVVLIMLVVSVGDTIWVILGDG